MEKGEGVKWSILALIALVFSSGAVIAGYNYIGNSIDTNYQAGQKITGDVVLGFDSEPSSSLFTSNFQGNITLIDLLKKNNLQENVDFTCVPSGCGKGYVEMGPVSNLDLDGSDKIVGFKLAGNSIVVDSAKLRIESDIGPSCSLQILVDVLDDGRSFMYNNESTDVSCTPKERGCFTDDAGSYDSATITNTRYCENLTLPASPSFEIGARVTNSTELFSLKMELYDSGWTFLGDCTLPEHTANVQDLSCVIDYSNINPENYYACIFSDGGDYTLRSEQEGENCGTDDFDSSTSSDFDIDYDIFGNGKSYADLNLIIDDDSFFEINGDSLGQNLVQEINDYINTNYGGDCSGSGCLIPFTISGNNQRLTFSESEIRYRRGGTLLSSTTLFELGREDSKISSDGANLSLDLKEADFVIPIGSKERKFRLFLEGSKVFSENINISESFKFDMSPKIVLIGIPTKFQVLTGFNVTSYLWDFGDGTSSSQKNPIHTYTSQGEYDVEVELIRADGIRATKIFNISVGNAEQSAENLLDLYEFRISKILSQISNLTGWIKPEVKSRINLGLINSSVLSSRSSFDNASNESDYLNIVTDLIALNVPSDIRISSFGALDLETGFSNIDTSYIENVSGELVPAEKKNELKGSIVAWFNNHYDADVEFETLTVSSDLGDSDLLTRYKYNINEKTTITGDRYLILDYPRESITFMRDYGAVSSGQGTYIPLAGLKEVEFLVSGRVPVQELGAYISPPVSELGRYSNIEFLEKKFPLGIFLLWLGILLISTLIVYVLLQEWYKKNYEKHLFKLKDQLYNLINFIYNARKSGLKDKDIKGRLKSTGWSGEQIRYGFNKIDGKRTGMWELPLLKFFENKRVEEEIAKRHEGRIDARFIKRPSF